MIKFQFLSGICQPLESFPRNMFLIVKPARKVGLPLRPTAFRKRFGIRFMLLPRTLLRSSSIRRKGDEIGKRELGRGKSFALKNFADLADFA